MSEAALREPGFGNASDTQAMFRRLLEATARPGTVVPLGHARLAIPPQRLRPACALLLSILDPEVMLAVEGPEAAGLAEYLRTNTGVRPAALEDADFVVVTGEGSGGRVRGAKCGRLEAPHEGATLVYAPTALGERGSVLLRLTGPGIPMERRLAVTGIAADEWRVLDSLRDFPMGVDIWLAAPDGRLAVIPRSTRWTLEV